jgi:hypothetical protein
MIPWGKCRQAPSSFFVLRHVDSCANLYHLRKAVDRAAAPPATVPVLARIAQLEAAVARLKKDSSTASKPPSSDITKTPRKEERGSGRKKKPRRGGKLAIRGMNELCFRQNKWTRSGFTSGQIRRLASASSFPGNGLVVDPTKGPTSWSTRDPHSGLKSASITSFDCLQTR